MSNENKHIHKYALLSDHDGNVYARCSLCGEILEEDSIRDILNSNEAFREYGVFVSFEEYDKKVTEIYQVSKKEKP